MMHLLDSAIVYQCLVHICGRTRKSAHGGFGDGEAVGGRIEQGFDADREGLERGGVPGVGIGQHREAERCGALHDHVVQARREAQAADVVYTPYFSGVPANYLSASILAAGLDPAELAQHREAPPPMLDKNARPKAWKDVWSAGQGVGAAQEILPVATLVAQLEAEYLCAREALARPNGPLAPAAGPGVTPP